MLNGDSKYTETNGVESWAPAMVAPFADEFARACADRNGGCYDECSFLQLSDRAGVIQLRNVYCAYELNGEDHRTLQLSIGWLGAGFHLMVAPEMTFVYVRGQWREADNPILCFKNTCELAAFCMNELKHHARNAHE